MTTLYTETPLSKAIFSFFSYIAKDIKKVTSKPGSYRAYIFGGCAFHIHTNARGSNDIDVEFNAARWMTSKEVIISKPSITYMNGAIERTLAFDSKFNTMLGPLHENYQTDAIQLQRKLSDSPLWIYVVTPEDLATSKLGRYSERDRDDILTLLQLKKMSVDSFYKRATEAIDYYVGNKTAVTNSLIQVINMYKHSGK
jgi:hypothetical protein